MVLLLNKLMLSKNIRKRNLLSFKGMKTSTRITGNLQKTQELIVEYSLFLMTNLLIQNEERYWPFQLLLLFFFFHAFDLVAENSPTLDVTVYKIFCQ